MLYTGFFITGIGIIFYVVHAVMHNRFLRKHHPEIFDDSLRQQHYGKRSKKVTVVVMDRHTPVLIMIFGIPSIPLFLLGIVITIVALIIKVFQ